MADARSFPQAILRAWNGEVITVTIAINTSLSGVVDIEGLTLLGILMPAAWTAANLTFQVSDESGGTFVNLYDDQGNEVVVQATISRGISIDLLAGALAPFRYLKIRAGTAGVPVNQAAARTLKIVGKG